MKFLIIEQDLRVTGTSQGVISRSFLAKLNKLYPTSVIDVHLITPSDARDDLDLLPVNYVKKHLVNTKVPKHLIFLNRFYWRLFHVSLKELYVYQKYASIIKAIDYQSYDHIFIRSAGINHEIIMATHGLPILKKAIVNFHDPYPLTWYVGAQSKVSNLELFRLKRAMEIAEHAKACSTTAINMSHDLQHLYASKKKFYTLPHQFDPSVFNLLDKSKVRHKQKSISISYHGAVMFGRNIENVIQAYEMLLNENTFYQKETELVLRMKGDGVNALKDKFQNHDNIHLLDQLDFANSANEQIEESDIVLILENGPDYCNILVGKAPFLAYYNKPLLSISPEKSELRNIIIDERCIANMHDIKEIKQKLKFLIDNRLVSNEPFYPFGDYFSDENFKRQLDIIFTND